MLKIAITSRALFDLDASHLVFTNDGLEAYKEHQISQENTPLNPGEAFTLVKKLLNLNDLYKGENLVEVMLLSRNTADTGLRIFNSIQHHGLDIKRAAFCGGASPHTYAKSFGAQLFLSTEFSDCKSSIENGVAAARIIPSGKTDMNDEVLKKVSEYYADLMKIDKQLIFKRIKKYSENFENNRNFRKRLKFFFRI